MPTDVIMPQMGESIFEGTITKWLKRIGDAVQKDEPLFEISTDKVDAEIPSPVAGVLSEIKVQEGATVEINTVVAVVSASGEAAAAPAPKAAAASAPSPAPVAAGDGYEETAAKPVSPVSKVAPAAAKSAPTESGPTAPVAGGTDVVMPQMGESIFEGTITKWLKKTGDTVQKDEPLFEISTDKVDAEIPSPVAGVLAEIKVPEGATVEINTVVAVIGSAAVAQAAAQSHVEAPSTSAPASAPTTTTPPVLDAKAAPLPDPAALPAPTNANGSERIRSSPLVRRIAKDNNLDLGQVPGTGSEGRITKDDILRHLSERGPGAVPSATAPTVEAAAVAATAPATPPVLAAAPTTAAAAAAAVTSGARPAAFTAAAPPQIPGELVPLSKMRAIIAQRMVESARISPHVHSVYKVDMSRIVRLREREKSRFEQQNGVKLTYMPFIALAAVETLRKFPIVNASLEGSSIRYHRNINLGIAVSLEWGLIVPVVKQAEERSFLGLARAIADLAARARGKKLLPDEVSGSTFTLTNSGILGEEFGTPIINQPDSAILAIGGLKKEAVVLTDAEGNDTIAIRPVQYFCLGFDHRTIDGADAGKFMGEFKKTLENWDEEIG
jgi:2-oxoglutarate dehydrogenase E2 component (dihydrolipoamide succinyltransferase)